MKNILITIMIAAFALTFGEPHSFAPGKGKKPVRLQAAEGEEVRVVVNTIKADKREQFEKFVFEIFWPLGKKVTGDERKAFIATRVLLPVKANDDGTYTCLFLMDPVIKDIDYQFTPLLRRFYGAEKAREYEQMFADSAAKPQSGYTVKQSRLF